VQKTSSGVVIPADLVIVGHIIGAYGLQGWVRIRPYASDADALLNAKTWWLDKPELHDVDMLQSKMHSGDVVARLMGVADRDAAEALKGTAIQVSRAHFPALADDEFYWVDLIGLAVENLQGESLGQVKDMMDNGAHPILRVVREMPNAAGAEAAPAKAADEAEILIPFVDRFVQQVDRTAKKIIVDWGLDYQ
jgi:16S rRNA processing protein RimM